jgi:phenylpropionate dioxygenase-like ring-hydroxylating dioxygenase large terminal subunit
MFDGFARVWSPVALSRELPAGAPLPVEVAGTRVVLFRDRERRAVGLVDRCPHRGVALSLGEVADGCITCPFHGWRLDGDGAVVRVPWNPDAKLGTLRGQRVPVRELGGLVWLYTDVGEEPASAPELHEAFLRPGVRVSGGSVEWRTHWTRAMENMLDWPHLPFVHRRTIGRPLVARADRRMDITWEERPWGAHTRVAIDGEEQPGALDFRWPNQMNLHVPFAGRTLVLAVACVPIDAERTRLILISARSFLRSRLFDFAFHFMNRRIANEDRAIVESSRPSVVPVAGAEQSVRTDGPTLHFRKRYFAELARATTAPLVRRAPSREQPPASD